MNRKWTLLIAPVLAALVISGCPTGDQGDDNNTVPDPGSGGAATPFLNIASTVNVLGLTYRRTVNDTGTVTAVENVTTLSRFSSLAAVVSNLAAGQTQSTTWVVDLSGEPAGIDLELITLSATSGEQVIVQINEALLAVSAPPVPSGTYLKRITATTTLTSSDGTTRTLTAAITLSIVVAEGASAAGDSTAVVIIPEVEPDFGVSGSGTVTLTATPAGPVATTKSIRWSPLFSSPAIPSSPAAGADGSILGAGSNGQVVLTPPSGLVGVFPYQVVFEDNSSPSQFATAVINVFLGYGAGELPVHIDVALQSVSLGAAPSLKLRTRRVGGEGPFTYAWTVHTDGASDPELPGVTPVLSPGFDASNESIEWTVAASPALANAGIVRFVCTVTDTGRVGHRSTASASVPFSDASLGVAIAPQFAQVAAMRPFGLRSVIAGGQGNITYTLRSFALGTSSMDIANATAGTPDNLAGLSPPSGSVLGPAENTWVIPGTLAAGYHRFEMTATDSTGRSAVATTLVLLGDSLSLDAHAQQLQVTGTGTLTNLLRTRRTGGVGGATVVPTTVRDRFGALVAAATLRVSSPASSTNEDQAWNVDAAAGLTPGTYQFGFRATDAAGNSVEDTAEVLFAHGLSLDVRARFAQVAGSGPFPDLLRTVRSGGADPSGTTITYQIFNSAAGGGTLVGATVPPGGATMSLTPVSSTAQTQDWQLNLLAGFVPGDYRFVFTASDSLGASFTDSVTISIAPPLTLDARTVTANVGRQGPTYTNLLRTERTSGSTPVTITYNVFDRNGTRVGGTSPPAGATISLAPASSTNASQSWTATLLAPPIAFGTYHFVFTATDVLGNVAVSSADVTFADPLRLDFVTRSLILGPGIPTRVRAVARGGSGNYFIAFNPPLDAEGDAAGAGILSAVDPNPPDDGERYYIPPLDGSGLYRLTATVTDTTTLESIGNVLNLFVVSGGDISSDRIIDAPASQTDLAGANPAFWTDPLGGTNTITDGAGSFAVNVTAPNSGPFPRARSLTLRAIDNNNNGSLDLSGATIEVIGRNQRGEIIVEEFIAPAVGTNITNRTRPFVQVDRVRWRGVAGAQMGDQIKLGLGDFFGLAAPFPRNDPDGPGGLTSNDRALRSFHIVVDGNNIDDPNQLTFRDPESGQLIANVNAPDYQSIRLTTAVPNGNVDLAVQHEVAQTMSVVATPTRSIIDTTQSTIIQLQVLGGVPPFDVAVTDLGSLTGDSTPGAFVNDSQTDVPLPLDVTYSNATETTDGFHILRVQVTDAANEIAVARVAIFVDAP